MNQLGILAKYWQPGRVKTRLATVSGDDYASRFHHAALRTLLRRFADFPGRRLLVYSPSHRGREFEKSAGDRWQLQAQSDGELGDRMRHYFQFAFQQGATRVLLIGSDSPTLPAAYLDQALTALDHHEVVLGPAEDGGYYLIAARPDMPELFDEVAWGSSRVWSQTVDKLVRSESSWCALPTWYDVDQQHDLQRLRLELKSLAGPEWEVLRQIVNERSD